MTTRTKPLQQATNSQDNGTKTPWYRSFLVWLGIVITLITTASAVAIIYFGHKFAVDQPPIVNTNAQGAKQLTHIFGVPLSRPDASENESAPSASDEQDNAETP